MPYTEYPLMFHEHTEGVDAEGLTLSALTWEAPAATCWVDAEIDIQGAG
jgi:hypothetical protein